MVQTLSIQLVFACVAGACIADDGVGAMVRDRRQGWDALMCSRIGFDP